MVAVLMPAAGRAQAAEKKSETAALRKPPAGMCRIWVDGVPPDKQPAATDCSTALRNKPTNGQVIFGDPRAPARAVPASAASRAIFPSMNRTLNRTFVPQHAAVPKSQVAGDGGRLQSRDSSKSRESGKSERDAGRTGREAGKTAHDTGRTGHDNTSGKKPPPR
jgi:hypothetical protein